jgi:MFS family permease
MRGEVRPAPAEPEHPEQAQEGEPAPVGPVPASVEPVPARLAPDLATSRLPRGLSAFRHRNFRLFWSGQLVSLTGTWMQGTAQAWLVLELTNDPLALGIVAAAQFTPVLVLGLFAGIVADATSKRRLLVLTQMASAALAVALGLLVVGGAVQPWHVYLLALGLGVVNAFDMPTRQSFVVEMVGRGDVGNAVALSAAVFNGTRIIGPALAGVLIALIGTGPLFLFNALTYQAVVVSLLLMRPAELVTAARAPVGRSWRAVVDRLAEGLRYVRATPTILLPILVLAVVATFALNFQVLMPVYTRVVLGGESQTFGLLMSAMGVGSLSGALLIAFGRRPSMRLLLTGVAAIGMGTIGLAVTSWLPISVVLMFMSGWGMISMAATTNTTIQLAVPDVLRGRVMSVYTTVFAGSVPLGGLLAGTVAAAFGAPAALAAGGLIALLTVGTVLLGTTRQRSARGPATEREVAGQG